MFKFIEQTENVCAFYISNVRKSTYVMRINNDNTPLTMEMPALVASPVSVPVAELMPPIVDVDAETYHAIATHSISDNTIKFIDNPTFVRNPAHYLTNYVVCYSEDGLSIAFGHFDGIPVMAVSTEDTVHFTQNASGLIDVLNKLDLPRMTNINVEIIPSLSLVETIVLYAMGNICKIAKSAEGKVKPSTFKKVAVLARLLPTYIGEDTDKHIIKFKYHTFIALASTPHFIDKYNKDIINEVTSVPIKMHLNYTMDTQLAFEDDAEEYSDCHDGVYSKNINGVFVLPNSSPVVIDLTEFNTTVDGHAMLHVAPIEIDKLGMGSALKELTSAFYDISPSYIRNVRYIIVDGTNIPKLYRWVEVVDALKDNLTSHGHRSLLPINVITLAAVYDNNGDIVLQDLTPKFK